MVYKLSAFFLIESADQEAREVEKERKKLVPSPQKAFVPFSSSLVIQANKTLFSERKHWVMSQKRVCKGLVFRCFYEHIMNLPFENYTGYLLSNGLYSKFCSLLSRLSTDFVQPTCRPSYTELYQPQRSLRSSFKLLFTVPTVNSVTYGERAFSFSAPILWNNLPDPIKNTTSLSSFKSALKTFLFRKFYF